MPYSSGALLLGFKRDSAWQFVPGVGWGNGCGCGYGDSPGRGSSLSDGSQMVVMGIPPAYAPMTPKEFLGIHITRFDCRSLRLASKACRRQILKSWAPSLAPTPTTGLGVLAD